MIYEAERAIRNSIAVITDTAFAENAASSATMHLTLSLFPSQMWHFCFLEMPVEIHDL